VIALLAMHVLLETWFRVGSGAELSCCIVSEVLSMRSGRTCLGPMEVSRGHEHREVTLGFGESRPSKHVTCASTGATTELDIVSV
jgi:hypothetical protein